MNEVYPLERAAEAYDRVMCGKARFRVVLTTGKERCLPLARLVESASVHIDPSTRPRLWYTRTVVTFGP